MAITLARRSRSIGGGFVGLGGTVGGADATKVDKVGTALRDFVDRWPNRPGGRLGRVCSGRSFESRRFLSGDGLWRRLSTVTVALEKSQASPSNAVEPGRAELQDFSDPRYVRKAFRNYRLFEILQRLVMNENEIVATCNVWLVFPGR